MTASLAGSEPPHGFDEDAATRRLLRSRPPRAALAWAGAVLGGTVTSARALRGGMSSAMHLLTVGVDGGAVQRVVLRRYVRPELNAEEPDIAQREVRALRFVEGLELPTPRPLAADPTGAEADAPALLMSRLPGRVDWSPPDMDRCLRRLAEVLPAIHTAPPPPALSGRTPRTDSKGYEPPAWARSPAVSRKSAEVFHRPTLDGTETLIHRDLHPGNVLWRRSQITGVVDWQAASIGPPSVDVGQCRVNLLGYGLDVADPVHSRLGGPERAHVPPVSRHRRHHRPPRRISRRTALGRGTPHDRGHARALRRRTRVGPGVSACRT